MELVPAALETRCLILLPAAPGLAPAVLDYYLRNAAFLAPFEPERPAGFYTAEHHARELAADVQRAAQGTGVRFYLNACIMWASLSARASPSALPRCTGRRRK